MHNNIITAVRSIIQMQGQYSVMCWTEQTPWRLTLTASVLVFYDFSFCSSNFGTFQNLPSETNRGGCQSSSGGHFEIPWDRSFSWPHSVFLLQILGCILQTQIDEERAVIWCGFLVFLFHFQPLLDGDSGGWNRGVSSQTGTRLHGLHLSFTAGGQNILDY